MNAKIAAVALVLGLASGAANAALSTTISPDGYSVTFADSRMAAGPFSFSTTFTEAAAGAMTGFSFNDAAMKSISYSLFDVTDNKTIYSGSSTGSFNFSEIFSANSTFKLTVSGSSNARASFVGTISAVPEPGEWAMMGSGLAMLGFLATRRRSASLNDSRAI